MTHRKQPPGPSHSNYLKSLRLLLRYAKDPLTFLERLRSEHGDFVRLKLSKYEVFVVSEPALVEAILRDTNRNFIKENRTPQARTVRRAFGNGLLTGEGAGWLRQRRLAQPAFAEKQISAYADTMVHYAEALVKTWGDGEHRNVYEDMRHVTRDIGAKIFFGLELDEDAKVIGDILQRMSDHVVAQTRILMVPERFPTPGNLRFNRDLARLDELTYALIARRRKETEIKDDIMGRLLRAQDDDGTWMTDEQLRNEVITIYVAGHETVALTLAWSLFLLTNHPEVQEQVAAEVAEVIGDATPTHAHASQLVLMDAVVKEALRLYPPIWRVGRQAVADVEVGHYMVPTGSIVLISQWLLHRDPAFFPRPGVFEPARWLRAEAANLPKCSFLPFGSGARVCIGQHLAMVEAKLVLATMVKAMRFERVRPDHPTFSPGVTLRPKNGIWARLHTRPTTQVAATASDRAAIDGRGAA